MGFAPDAGLLWTTGVVFGLDDADGDSDRAGDAVRDGADLTGGRDAPVEFVEGLDRAPVAGSPRAAGGVDRPADQATRIAITARTIEVTMPARTAIRPLMEIFLS